MTELEVVDYRPAVVLFRIAVAASKRARERSRQYKATRDGERRNREADACIETIILTQAALEAAIKQELQERGLTTKRSWVACWDEGPTEIAGWAGRPADFTLPAELEVELKRLSTWRQFFVHGDKAARGRIAKEVGDDSLEIPNRCDADLAEHWIAQADKLFEWFAEVTGIVYSPSRLLWVPLDDL